MTFIEKPRVGNGPIGDGLKWLERQGNRLAQAQLGETTVGPGDGALVFTDNNGVTIMRLSSDGIYFWYQGVLQLLNDLLDGKATLTYVNQKVTDLMAADTDLTNNKANLSYVNDQLDTKANLSYVNPKLTDLTNNKANLSYVNDKFSTIGQRLNALDGKGSAL